MSPVDLLERAYADLHAVLADLAGEAEWAPTGCAGWCVRDLVQHLLGDARRALVAVGSPADRPPDTDAVSYWRAWTPGTEAAVAERRLTRVVSGVWTTLEPLRLAYAETCSAAVHLLRITDAAEPLATQGHVLSAADLTRTLVFEAAVHHLDLVAYLAAPGPGDDALGLVRATLDGLLGQREPCGWDDVRYARVGTGREGISHRDRATLGLLAERFPLTC
ncbi:MAG TPA: maleylpyruvate isomerase N-terminal domain-containing protein [Nocardioidaceae bacterium]|nr:maleylpyruvate isomerase N-terminal domain-containing protein [Nocardioidaceae bacterium]